MVRLRNEVLLDIGSVKRNLMQLRPSLSSDFGNEINRSNTIEDIKSFQTQLIEQSQDYPSEWIENPEVIHELANIMIGIFEANQCPIAGTLRTSFENNSETGITDTFKAIERLGQEWHLKASLVSLNSELETMPAHQLHQCQAHEDRVASNVRT